MGSIHPAPTPGIPSTLPTPLIFLPCSCMTASMFQAERDVADLVLALAKRAATESRALSDSKLAARGVAEAAWVDDWEAQLGAAAAAAGEEPVRRIGCKTCCGGGGQVKRGCGLGVKQCA